MDVQRSGTRKRHFRRIAYAAAVGLGFVALAGFAWSLASRPPGIDRDYVYDNEVIRGEFVHEVTANGRLEALDVRTVTNRSAGVVEKINVLAGHHVAPDDVLVELSSPNLREELADAISSLEAAEANERLRLAEAEDNYLNLLVTLAGAEADYETALMESEAQELLMQEGASSAIEMQRITSRAEQQQRRLEAVEAQVERYPETQAARDTAAQADLEQKRRQVDRLREKVSELKVTAGFSGVVQEVSVEEGQRLGDGSDVARVVNPENLIARVRVSERDAELVQPGQSARLQMGRQRLMGRVTRVEPTVRERLVTVDIELVDEEASGLRPDVSVTANIEIDRAEDTLVVERPADLRDDQKEIELFVLDDDQSRARRVNVQVGRISPGDVEILRGLEAGDRIITSTMTEWVEDPEIREIRIR